MGITKILCLGWPKYFLKILVDKNKSMHQDIPNIMLILKSLLIFLRFFFWENCKCDLYSCFLRFLLSILSKFSLILYLLIFCNLFVIFSNRVLMWHYIHQCYDNVTSSLFMSEEWLKYITKKR